MNEIYTLYYQEGENVCCKKQNPDRLLYQDFFVPRADTIPIKYQKIKTTNITVYQYITFSHLCQYNPYFPIYSQSLSLFCPPNKI